MRPQVVTASAVSTSPWIPLDWKQNPFNIGFGVVVNGTITYTIEHTFDEVFNSAVTPTAFPHPTIAAQTINKDGNYAFPVRAIRINNTAGTGSTTLTILQGQR